MRKTPYCAFNFTLCYGELIINIMYEVNFILDEKFDKELVQTEKVNIPFLPRIGDTVIIQQFFRRKHTHYTISDVLINYKEDFTIRFIEIFVKGAF